MITTGQIAQQGRVSRFLEATSDAEGLFAFERVPKGFEVELVWWGKGVVPGRADHLEVAGRKEGERIEVTTQAPARLIGAIDRKRHPEAGRIRVAEQTGAIEYDDLGLRAGQDESGFNHLAPGTDTATLSGAYERVPGSRWLTTRPLASGKATIGPGGNARVDFKD